MSQLLEQESLSQQIEALKKEVASLKTNKQTETMRLWKLEFLQRIQLSLRTHLFKQKYTNLLSLNSFQNIHKRKRCFIIGNGPSLRQINMELLKDEITFGSNRCYLGFKEWGYAFTYWGIQDETQIIQSAQEYIDNIPSDVVKFLPYHFLEYFNLTNKQNCCPINIEFHPEPYPQFSKSPNILFTGWTITYALIQIAVIMGCNPIYLVGMDYNYNITENEKRTGGKWSDSQSKYHFHPDYCNDKNGILWNVPRFDFMNPAFDYANNWSLQNNIQILNATPNSNLNSFKKIEFEKLF